MHYIMSASEYLEIKELVRQVIQQYVMNQYPWGVITRPLTPPVSMSILFVTYIMTIAMLALSLIQIAVLVRYSMIGLRYTKNPRRRSNTVGNGAGFRKLPPLVSILIPIKNEDAVTIKRSLQNIAGLNYPRNLIEVIYISDDPEHYVNSLIEYVEPMVRRLGLNVRILRREDNTGYKGGALNFGLEYAVGDVIAVFDVDTILPSDYLMKAVEALFGGYDAVTAVWKGYYTVSNSIARLMKFMYDVYNETFIRGGRFLGGGFPAISSNNLVIWRRVLSSVNGFCRCTGEDLDLSIKLRAMGYRVGGLLDSVVYCEVPYTYPSLKRQFSRWLFNGIWNMKHNLRLLLSSKGTTVWEKVDGLLWMLQFPSISFAALSILITVVLSIIGVLIPPMPILFLEITNILIAFPPLIIALLSISKYVGYNAWDSISNAVKSALIMVFLSFPMLIYSVESLLTDDWEWVPTPKGTSFQHAIHRNALLQDLIHEILAISILVMVMIVLVINKQLLTTIYIASIVAIMMYGLRLIVPQNH